MKSTRRIGLLLTLVFLLPALFFSVYEISSLDSDEEMMEEIYQKQLEAILFSVNQYSDDIIGNWMARVETSLATAGLSDSVPEKITELLSLNTALSAIFVADTAGHAKSLRLYQPDQTSAVIKKEEILKALSRQRAKIQELVSYRKRGFQKIERLELDRQGNEGLNCMVFITRHAQDSFLVTGLFLDSELFIEDIVGPRLQTVARDQFVLSAMVKGTDSVVYTTRQASEQDTDALTADFWIFPDVVLGIHTVGNTLQQVINERTRTNFFLLLSLDLIMIVALILVFRNLRKEVNLAQNKSDFVSNVSHEIRTPLALISMFAETLEMGRVPTEEKKQEYYRIIHRESQRLTGIVNRILTFSQTEAKKKTFHLTRLGAAAEVNAVMNTYDFHLRNKGFDYFVESTKEIWIRADREALTECIINLIDNAMKYSEDIRQIEIRITRDRDHGLISVTDKGIGISRQDQKNIFDKFYRVAGGNLARTRGTGLGLSLVKQLMESQKGKVTVVSERGAGSTFTLHFPLD